MAQLTDADFREIRDTFYRKGYGKEEIIALAGGQPAEVALKAGIQSFEDYIVANFGTIKSGLDAALVKTTTNTGAQKLFAGYLLWKIKQIVGA